MSHVRYHQVPFARARGIAQCVLLAKPEVVVEVAKARGIRVTTRS